MEIIYNKIFLEHATENHPESKERLISFGDLKGIAKFARINNHCT